VSVPTRTFEHGEREERRFDAVALSHRTSGGKGSPAATAATLASALQGLPHEERVKFLNAYDYRVAGWLADLINGR
jgi:hypothetical protein